MATRYTFALARKVHINKARGVSAWLTFSTLAKSEAEAWKRVREHYVHLTPDDWEWTLAKVEEESDE